MKLAKPSIIAFAALLVVFLITDILYLSKLEKKFLELEHERIVTSNQLATAKIIAENLNHVRDLVFQNMTFPGRKDSVSVDMGLYTFLTECSRDLKIKIQKVQPLPKERKGRITSFRYEVEMECDFFSFGEFCSKLENNRRIIALSQFELSTMGAEKQNALGMPLAPGQLRSLALKLQLNTFQVTK
jgi:Tfp pilus assembly protein PilO